MIVSKATRIRRLFVYAVSIAALVLVTEASRGEDTADERADKPRVSNTLRWTTATEVDNFGYDVYRSESEDGTFVRLNERPIPGAGTTDSPTEYEYVDDTIEPDTAYWYYVESIALDNTRERFTPIFRAKPKSASEDEKKEGR